MTDCKVCGGSVPLGPWMKGQWVCSKQNSECLGPDVGRIRMVHRNDFGVLVQWFTGPRSTVFGVVGVEARLGYGWVRKDQVEKAAFADIETARKSCRSCAGTGEQAVAVFLQHVEAG